VPTYGLAFHLGWVVGDLQTCATFFFSKASGDNSPIPLSPGSPGQCCSLCSLRNKKKSTLFAVKERVVQEIEKLNLTVKCLITFVAHYSCFMLQKPTINAGLV